MRARITCTILVIATFLTPAVSRAQSIDALRSQIATLLSQIVALQAQVQAAPSVSIPAIQSAPCVAFTRDLSRGSRGEDVRTLQGFLVAQGLLKPESATGYFGALTETALKEWQSLSGVVSGGDAASTGWGVLGPRTRSLVAARCGTSAISVASDLSASPMEGNAPLTVVFTSLVGDNAETRPSYVDGRDMVLDFGDGAAPLWIQCPGTDGRCALPKQVHHTYVSSGTYTASLKKTGGRCIETCADEVVKELRIFVGGGQPSCSISSTPVQGDSTRVTLSWASVRASSASLVNLASGEILQVALRGSRTVALPLSGAIAYELRVTNGSGASSLCGTKTDTSQDLSTPGGTALIATPSSGSSPLVVTFSGTVQSSGYSIDFGDGESSGDIGCPHGSCPPHFSSTSVNVSHSYRSPGIYMAKLRKHASITEGRCVATDCNVVSSVLISVGPR